MLLLYCVSKSNVYHINITGSVRMYRTSTLNSPPVRTLNYINLLRKICDAVQLVLDVLETCDFCFGLLKIQTTGIV